MNGLKSAFVLALFLATAAHAQPPSDTKQSTKKDGETTEKKEKSESPKDPIQLDPIDVSYTPESVSKVSGSAHILSEEELKVFQYDDPSQVLDSVPGVYVRQEDGYGLRPNIGLRGVNSERSKKVTLMEDGILFGPAPYSAPAAYYFPLITRAIGMEVFKGPAAIQYGPQTIGGAINVITRKIPYGHVSETQIAYGLNNYLKAHSHYGWGGDRGGFLVEGVHLMTDGFKELDGGGDTGFSKQEFMIKGQITSDPLSDIFHEANIKLGFSREVSNETYLGLSDSDFRKNPNRRYRATQLDQMNLMRFQVEGNYGFQRGENFDLKASAYWHGMQRAWKKVSRFGGSSAPSLSDILADPDSGQRKVFYDVLTGKQDSSSDLDTIMLGNNDREFTVVGGQTETNAHFQTGPVKHDIRAGLRYHYDEIERNHTEEGYLMQNGDLVRDDEERQTTTRNRGRASAVAGYASYSADAYGLTVNPGVRLEYVETQMLNRLTDVQTENSHLSAMPGLGIHYQITPELKVLSGVYKGFSPLAPGQDDDVDPEESINYELGFRYARPQSKTLVEAIGFYSDYSNLIAECTFSSGCDAENLDKQFNGGAVDVVGVEILAAHTFKLPAGLKLPIRATYTYTYSTFQTAFQSSNPQFGDVEKGDHLPYVPDHRAALHIGIGGEQWGVDFQGNYLSEMRETAGQASNEKTTDAIVLLDASAHYKPLQWLELTLKAENLLMEQGLVSRRPYGARPSKPFLFMGGVRLHF